MFSFDMNLDSEAEEDPFEDGDTVKDVSQLFRKQFTKVHEEAAVLKKKYITHSDASSSFSKIAIGLENEMQIYDVTQTGLNKYLGKNEFGQLDQNVSGIKFFNEDPNTVVCSTIAGQINIFDLRTMRKVHCFEGNTRSKTTICNIPKPFNFR